MQYCIKLAAQTDNTTYDCVYNPQYAHLYEAKEKEIPSFGMRMKPLLENTDFELENTMKETTLGIPPSTHVPPKINFDIAKRKKSETAEDVFRSNFNEIRAKFPNYQCIYTNDSKTSDAVAAAAITPTYSMSKACNKSNSIFSAELRELILALEYIKTTNHSTYIMFSNSKSSLQAL